MLCTTLNESRLALVLRHTLNETLRKMEKYDLKGQSVSSKVTLILVEVFEGKKVPGTLCSTFNVNK